MSYSLSRESMERSSSHGSRPIAMGNREQNKPPFKLCFSRQQQIGRSNVSVSRTNADFVTPKFYSGDFARMENANVNATVEQIAKENRSPVDTYKWPLLTSHTYGWWHDKGIRTNDPRFDFHKRTSDLVSFQMKIYAEDRKLKGLNY